MPHTSPTDPALRSSQKKNLQSGGFHFEGESIVQALRRFESPAPRQHDPKSTETPFKASIHPSTDLSPNTIPLKYPNRQETRLGKQAYALFSIIKPTSIQQPLKYDVDLLSAVSMFPGAFATLLQRQSVGHWCCARVLGAFGVCHLWILGVWAGVGMGFGGVVVVWFFWCTRGGGNEGFVTLSRRMQDCGMAVTVSRSCAVRSGNEWFDCCCVVLFSIAGI